MNMKPLRWILAAGLLISSHLSAQPLDDLRARMAALRNEQPIKLKVEVELKHKGTAPLHLNSEKLKGTAVIVYGPKGVKVQKQKSRGEITQASIWRDAKDRDPKELITEDEALALVNPAAILDLALNDATLLGDGMTTWQDRPARLLVFLPSEIEKVQAEAPADGPLPPVFGETKLWLDESGVPLAMERSGELLLGPALKVEVREAVEFQQVAGRLLVARWEENYSGTALAVLRGGDSKKIKVTVLD
ncbi:MAG TPA: hypothetical protein VF789_14435 [Thermoanaerobaculia bacterium]